MRLGSRSAVVTLLIAVTVGLTQLVSAPAGAATLAERQQLLRRSLDDASFFWTMYANRSGSPYREFDWSTDLCSAAPDDPFGFAFAPACRRHDFGYRNFKANGLWNTTNKSRIDRAFSADMNAVCARYPTVRRRACSATAAAYSYAVTVFGT